MKLFAKRGNAPKVARMVWVLSWVSFFTDVASEMLYPVMPVYLASVGISVAGIALIEGLAEAIAGVTKSFFGFLGDRIGKPERYVQAGYGLSALVKPVMGFFASPAALLVLRLGDRFGKGIRSTPRDAILTQYSDKENRGRIFGLHRSMDSLGAALGPLIALALIIMFNWSNNLENIFFVASVPGIAAVILTFKVRARRTVRADKVAWGPLFKDYTKIFRLSRYTGEYRRLLGGLVLVSVLNSSDVFLLLRAREIVGNGIMVTGMKIDAAIAVIAVYILYNLVYAAASRPMGNLADRIGFKQTYLGALCIFVVSYTLLAQTGSLYVLIFAMAAYGFFAAGNDAVVKAWTSLTLKPENMGSGLGVVSTLQSLTFLFSSLMTGLVWQSFGSKAALSVSALGMLLPIAYFHFLVPAHKKEVA
jgi:MFS family permease